MKTTTRLIYTTVLTAGIAVTLSVMSKTPAKADSEADNESQSEIQRGLGISPVKLNLTGKNRSLVGRGSYIVNAQGACVDCHTCPSYVGKVASDNPYANGGTLSQIDTPGPVNSTNYLAGGVHFGPFVSSNLTPDPTKGNQPEGLTFTEFLSVIQTGHDPDVPNHILQVMPWPVYRHMTLRDLSAIYEFLSSIPHAMPGTCAGAGEFQIRP